MGLANLVADAISMGLGDALSEKAELEHVRREHKRENWEMENNPQGEVEEMVELYLEKGVSEFVITEAACTATDTTNLRKLVGPKSDCPTVELLAAFIGHCALSIENSKLASKMFEI